MKIIFLLNSISKTSIPKTWSEFITKHHRDIEIKNVTLKNLLKNIKHESKSTIIHGHHVKSMFLFLLFNKLIGLKTVYTVHGSYLYLSDTNKYLFKSIMKHTDHIVFVNKELYDVIPAQLKNQIKDKFSIVLNGVDYNFKFRDIDVYKKYGLREDEFIYFHPARFVREKNHLKLLNAFKKIVDKYPDSKLVLAGDGKLKEQILDNIKSNQLENKVVLLGIIERDEVYCFLDKSDLFLMPSVSEGLNVSFLEAFSRKANILVSNINQFVYPLDYYSINPEEYNIILVDPDNEDSIAEGLMKAQKLEKITSEVNTCFSLDKLASDYIHIYSNLIRG